MTLVRFLDALNYWALKNGSVKLVCSMSQAEMDDLRADLRTVVSVRANASEEIPALFGVELRLHKEPGWTMSWKTP